MKFLDLFAGIGGFRLGMEMAGHECVGYVEIDKFARKSYEAIHDTKGEWTASDIRSVSDESIRGIRSVDIICGGFPCQAFSVAGKRKGFEDTRGTLFFEIMRFASILRPRTLFLENVGGLLNHDGGDTFETILRTMDEVGYDAEWDVLNSKNFGVPQNRQRVFIIGHLRGERSRKVFPLGETNTNTGNEIKRLGHSKYFRRVLQTFDPNGSCEALDTMQGGNRQPCVRVVDNVNPSGNGMNGNVFDSNGLAPTITTNKGEGPKIVQAVLTPERTEKRQNGRRFKEPGEPMFTITAQDKHGVMIQAPKLVGGIGEINFGKQFRQGNRVYDSNAIAMCLNAQPVGNTGGNSYLYQVGYKIRKLTPRECWRLQGFPDWAFDKAAEVNSDSQLYKQAGNSVTVNVIYEIAKQLS